LQWVQQHIEKFQGDPTQVTLFGESAGALSVCMLAASPLMRGKNFFKRIIMESGPCNGAWGPASEVEGALASDLEISQLPGWFNHSLSDLRSVDPMSLVNMTVMPSLDGLCLAEDPLHAWKAGDLALPEHGEVIIGGNSADGLLQWPWLLEILAPWGGKVKVPQTLLEFSTVYKKYFPKASDVAAIAALYHADVNATQAMVLIGADLSVLCPNRALLRTTSNHSHPLYGYYYAYDETGMGAPHGAELESVFGTRNTSLQVQLFSYSALLSEVMRAFWTNFAQTGQPKAPGVPEWKQFGSAQSEMQLSEVVESSIASKWRTSRCDYWDSYAVSNPWTARKRMRAAALLLPLVV